MKLIYDQIVANLNKHIVEYQFKLNYDDTSAFIYVYDKKEFVYIIDMNGLVKSTKITNPNQLYRICLIILETKVGV